MPVNAALSAINYSGSCIDNFWNKSISVSFVSRRKRNTASDPVSGKSTDSGGVGMLVVYCLKVHQFLYRHMAYQNFLLWQ